MGRGEYGICPSCKKYKYLSGTTCKTCSYQMGTCLACEKQSKIYVDGLCYLCYQDRQVLATIESLERGFHPLNDYNKQLFQLYLSYIKRYRLFYAHIRITKELINVLQNDEISIISGWFDIYMLSDRYVIMQKPQKLQGCVFIKIGNMLSELGIISPREDDRDHELQNKLSCLVTPNVQDFVNDLLKINTAKRSIIHILRELTLLETFAIQGFEIYSLFLLDRFHLLQFFDQQVELTNSEHNRKKLYLDIKRFYRWAILNRHININ
ncbi:hypothetical protein KAR28_07090, partial [Candidatus Parcubacteria bacterium]|nr:hypothetical protein [Candidatus Parcubacteria bacterium]